MSINKLDETLSNLDLDSAAQELKDSIISKSMNNLKEKMSGLDIRIESKEDETIQEAPKPRYGRTELADVARKVYRDNINPADKEAVEKKSGIAGALREEHQPKALLVFLLPSHASVPSSCSTGCYSFAGTWLPHEQSSIGAFDSRIRRDASRRGAAGRRESTARALRRVRVIRARKDRRRRRRQMPRA